MSSSSLKKRVVFFGTPDFAATGLQALLEDDRLEIALIITQPDKPAGRGGLVKATPVKELALSKDIPVLQPVSIKKELDHFLQELNKYGPFDVGVVIAFGQILPIQVLDYPAAGCVNVHASLLPRWRGAAPIQRAILAGDKATGICLMRMDAGLDTGPVYSTKSLAIESDDNLETLHDKLAKIGAQMLQQDLMKIINLECQAKEQIQDGTTYASKVLPAEMKIVWSESTTQILSKIRAFSPSPGAYCLLQDKRLKVFKAAPVQIPQDFSASPGKIYFVDKSRLEVECGAGIIALTEVQLEGKKRLPVAEFLKGVRLDTSIFFL